MKKLLIFLMICELILLPTGCHANPPKNSAQSPSKNEKPTSTDNTPEEAIEGLLRSLQHQNFSGAKKYYVENFDKSEDITISGEPLLYPELYKILEMYNPTTGARPFMPQMIMKIDASLPKLPKYYDRFNLNLEGIENKL